MVTKEAEIGRSGRETIDVEERRFTALTWALYKNKVNTWLDAFAIPDQDYKTYKSGIGQKRIDTLRKFQSEVNLHRNRHSEDIEHVVIDIPLGSPRKKNFNPDAIVVDRMEVPFICPEVSYMIKEMLGGSLMDKEKFLDHMRQMRVDDPMGILKRDVNFLNKYFHLRLANREIEVNGVTKCLLVIPESTVVIFDH